MPQTHWAINAVFKRGWLVGQFVFWVRFNVNAAVQFFQPNCIQQTQRMCHFIFARHVFHQTPTQFQLFWLWQIVLKHLQCTACLVDQSGWIDHHPKFTSFLPGFWGGGGRGGVGSFLLYHQGYGTSFQSMFKMTGFVCIFNHINF